MIAASLYLPKSIQKRLIELVIKFQHDSLFKSAYTQILTVLYPVLFCLTGNGTGSLEESVLVTTVQIFTSDKMVRSILYFSVLLY